MVYKMNNLHISLTNFKNESRVLKETESILKHNIAKEVFIASLYSKELKEEEVLSFGAKLKRFKLISRKLHKNIFSQFIKYIEFSLKIIFHYKNKNIKIINVHSIGLLPLGVLIKYIYNAKLVYDTHELETEKNGLSGFRKRLIKKIEKRLIKKVDILFVVSKNIANWYAKEYNIEKPALIMNAPKLFETIKNNHFREKFNISKDNIIIIYQGALSKGRGVELLLETFKSRKDTKVVIVFMGYGIFENEIKEASKNYKNIYFHNAVAPNDVLKHTISADIGISFIENTCLSYYYCMPNKFFEYAMVGLPIIVSNMKEMSETVNKYNIGIVVEEDTKEGLNKAIDIISNLDIKTLKENAKKFAKENSWELQEKKMIEIYKRFFIE